MSSRSSRRGFVCALAGAVCWAVSSVCASFLMDGYGVCGMQLTFYRLLASAVLFAVLFVLKYRAKLAALFADRAARRALPLFGLVLFFCQGSYVLSIGFSNAGTATLLQSLNIVFIPVLVWALYGKRPCFREFLGAALAFAAVVCVAAKGDFSTLSMPFWGLFWGLFCAVSLTFYFVCPSGLFARWGSLVFTGLGMIFAAPLAAVGNAAAAALLGPDAGSFAFPQLDAAGWLALLGVCVVGTFLAFSLFLHGVETIGPVLTSMLGAVEPLTATILSAAVLHTAFTGWDWLGLALMLVTICIVSIRAGEV